MDAVAESRKWKEAVAKETEGMTAEQIVAYFDHASVRRRLDAVLRRGEQEDDAGADENKQGFSVAPTVGVIPICVSVAAE